jgi:hypothetical protein
MRRVGGFALLGAVLLVLAGCGGGEKKAEENGPTQAACSRSELAESPKLPASFPQIENVTYTKQRTDGPTHVVEGYFMGSIQDAHDEYKKELQGAGFKILFDELEEHDSEVSWSGEGRTGQVALREECGENEKIYVHVTSRPE